MNAEDGEGPTGLAILCSDHGVTPAMGHIPGLLCRGRSRGPPWGPRRSTSVAPTTSREKIRTAWTALEGRGSVILTPVSFFHI